MIFRRPPPEAPVDQGDLIDDCPLLAVASFDTQTPPSIDVEHAIGRVVVLTQTCDLANQKAIQAVVAVVLDAESLVASGRLKSADILGPIRAGRVFGWYFLPKSASHRDSGGGQRLSKRTCHCFVVCGEAVFFETLIPHRHCFSADSDAVARPL